MKKLFTPILYPLFFIPTFIITIFFAAFSDRVYGFIFPGTGVIEALIGIIIPGGLLFLLANMLMQKVENLEAPTVTDHFRQSSLWYLGIALGIAIFPTQGGLGSGMLIVALVTGGYAVSINALYLYIISRKVTKTLQNINRESLT